MTHPTDDSLKPCPFCGGAAKVSVMRDESIWSHEIVPYTKVECGDCGIGTDYLCEGWEPTAQEAWNTRALLAEQARIEPTQEFESAQGRALASAWAEGWAQCRDAEYVGEEAESEAFNQSHTLAQCLYADQTRFQGGLSNDQLRRAWSAKLPNVIPTDEQLTAFALGIEAAAQPLKTEDAPSEELPRFNEAQERADFEAHLKAELKSHWIYNNPNGHDLVDMMVSVVPDEINGHKQTNAGRYVDKGIETQWHGWRARAARAAERKA